MLYPIKAFCIRYIYPSSSIFFEGVGGGSQYKTRIMANVHAYADSVFQWHNSTVGMLSMVFSPSFFEGEAGRSGHETIEYWLHVDLSIWDCRVYGNNPLAFK